MPPRPATSMARRTTAGLLLTLATTATFAGQAAAAPAPAPTPTRAKIQAENTLRSHAQGHGTRPQAATTRSGQSLIAAIQAARSGHAIQPHTATPSDAPTTVATITTSGTANGVWKLTADSTAAQVQFFVNGASVGTAAVSSGAASLDWATWGYANGAVSVTATDCAADNACGGQSGATSLDIENPDQPTVTSPAQDKVVTGGFTMTATAPTGFSGAIGFLIDGSLRGYDSSAPYSLAYTGTALSEGGHYVTAVECSVDGTRCNGPVSSDVTFMSDSLHPAITSISANPFSPNHDGVDDTAKITFTLPDTEHVTLQILRAGSVVRGPVDLGTHPSGTYSWTWAGTNNSGARLGDSTYTVQLNTSATVNGATVQGQVNKAAVIDTTAPVLSSITGNGAKFYPYPDGYVDTLAPGVTLNEPAVLTLTVRRTDGSLVRTISASEPAGRRSIAWNGRSNGNHLMEAGTYKWSYSAIDNAGNRRNGPTYGLIISAAKLVAKSATITKNGNSYYTAGASDTNCAGYAQSASMYSAGVWMENVCDPDWDGAQIAAAFYHVSIPAAVKYGHLTATTYGSTINPPSQIGSAYVRTDGNVDLAGTADVNSGTGEWRSLGSVLAAGHYDSNHIVDVAIFLTDGYNGGGFASDFDLGQLRVTVGYYVLQ